jgi:uncharacterized protein Veg
LEIIEYQPDKVAPPAKSKNISRKSYSDSNILTTKVWRGSN